MSEDIAVRLAQQWTTTTGQAQVPPESFWPICRLLSAEGLLTSNNEALTTIEIGPFRIASPDQEPAISEFVDALVPVVIAGAISDASPRGLVSGVLASATAIFIKTLKHGVLFGRDEASITCWRVLLEISEANKAGRDPNLEEIVKRTNSGQRKKLSRDEVLRAADWLTNAPPMHGKIPIALIEFSNGTFHSLV